jgi:D-aspartate ligase
MTTISADRPVAATRVATMTGQADASTPAVVLKFDPNVMHHGGLGAIRSLGRLGVPVYAVLESPWAPAGHSRYVHGKVLWQPEHLTADRILAGLRRLATLIGEPAVLIPTDDAGALFLAEHGSDLRESYLFPDPPASLPRQLAGKHSLHALCAELGFPSPASSLPSSLPDAADLAVALGYPVVAKLARPWQSQSRGRTPRLPSTQIIADRAGLEEAWHDSHVGGAALMLQQFIPAAPGHDWFFHGYVSSSGVCWPACTGVKDRSYPAHAGLTSFGRCVPNDALRDSVTELLTRLGYRGIADLDLRLDDRDGQYKLLDCNPRLGAQFRLFTGPGGLDVVRAAYLDLTGQPVAGAEPVPGRSFMVESYDPMTAIRYWRAGETSVRSWLSAAFRVDETAWFARDDLRPFQLMCIRMGWRMLTRPLLRGTGAAARSYGPGPGKPAGPRLRWGRSKAGRRQAASQPTNTRGDG